MPWFKNSMMKRNESELKTLIAVLGFEESIIIGAVLRHKLDPGDRLVILTSRDKEDERAISAKTQLKSFVQQVGMGKPWLELSIIPLSEHDVEETILEILSLLNKEVKENREIIVEVSGGLRVLGLALTLAALFISEKVKGIYLVTEHTKKLIKIPEIRIKPHLSTTLQEIMLTIFSLKEASLEKISSVLDKDLSTVSRQTMKLEQLGLINRESSRPAQFTSTFLGKVFIVLMEESQRERIEIELSFKRPQTPNTKSRIDTQRRKTKQTDQGEQELIKSK